MRKRIEKEFGKEWQSYYYWRKDEVIIEIGGRHKVNDTSLEEVKGHGGRPRVALS